jgi:hypothetical protein
MAAGKRTLDFPRSYAIQVVPSVLIESRQTLLQGSIGILDPGRYDDKKRESALAEVYLQANNSLKKESDPKHVVVQELSNGKKKIWSDILVGKEVNEAVVAGIHLKQSLRSEVVFRVEAIA